MGNREQERRARNARADRKNHDRRKQRTVPRNIREFRKSIWQHFKEKGRDLPWRRTTDPYQILVSEIMLQQTQVERVLLKYGQFINAFPDFPSLARAPLRTVLKVWQGMGYNRRAIALREIARKVVREHGGKLPSTIEGLRTLPCIGSYTAAAIAAFASNQPAVVLDTNIRRVFIHFFFDGAMNVRDSEILPLVEHTMDKRKPGLWYNALMDYGAMLKMKQGNSNRRSAHYKKQSRFDGSNRQMRGRILRVLLKKSGMTARQIVKELDANPERVGENLDALRREGFIRKKGSAYAVA